MRKHVKKPWTKDEIELLNVMARQGTPNSRIAAAMGRSVGSIMHKRSELHITETELGTVRTKCPEPTRKPYTEPTVTVPAKILDAANANLKEALTKIDVLTAQNTELQRKLNLSLGHLDSAQSESIQEVRRLHDEYIKLLSENAENRARLKDEIFGIETYLKQPLFYRIFHRFGKNERK